MGERRSEEDRPKGLREERRRDEKSRQELEHQVFRPQDAQDRLGADRYQPDEEIDRGSEEECENCGHEEERAGRG